MSTTRASTAAATAARVVAILAVLAAAGSLLMAISHAGVRLPLLAALGPDGSQALPGVAAGFAVGAALFAALAVGAWRQHAWAWALGLVMNGLALVATTVPWRGPVSGAAAVVTAAGLAVLLARPGRAAFLSGHPEGEASPAATQPRRR